MSNYDASEAIIQYLDEEKSRELLHTVSLGRVVVRRSDDMDIFPVNYVIDPRGDIYFRSAEGNKLFTINLNHDVLFEVDHVVDGRAWSVVVRGMAEVLQHAEEIEYAEGLGIKPWIPTLKYNFVKVTATEFSGRSFQLGEEPEHVGWDGRG
ncbi:pyridoxamine 5-phosphate oxidase [Corynebacterium atypicum]|uniref:Pyridoxamine 5-phosphate oxidase n=1 Tax=Corynebacterium atypicum TaxID=191610 RepID=A0ABM5QPD6_9CORY|nr:pyridoxamine 5'-phosphate oxidase family protein [Corynebacterium atypicum]AIG64616.1 pyridoxamine 5-phosphate oxidase [Corynebacterium atypicum]